MASSSKILSLAGFLATLIHASPLPPPDDLPSYPWKNFTKLSPDFKWKSIKPSPELEYHDCGGNFTCARLELPLNWNATGPEDLTHNEKFNMAIVKLPAQVKVTDPRYGGPVLINPGGPGASGIEYALTHGPTLQTMLDAAYSFGSLQYVSGNKDARYFDIIGFDPRGVGESTPHLDCAHNFRQLTKSHLPALELAPQVKEAMEARWREAEQRGRQCMWDPAADPNAGSKIANFSSSAMVVRDMVEFVERHGEWRETQAVDSLQRVALKWNKGEEPVSLFGASYGTVLGALLAAMQPHRVRRLLLDGVVDSQAYFEGNLTANAVTADDPAHKFFEYCALAGPEDCSMWSGNSSRDTERRYRNILLDLEEHGPRPHPIIPGRNISASLLRDMMAHLDDDPLLWWPSFADLLSRLSTGIAPLGTDKYTAQIGEGAKDSSQEIRALLDADDLDDNNGGDLTARLSPQEFVTQHWVPLRKVIPLNADVEAFQSMTYFNWPIQFGWRFGDKHAVASNVTANPILFSSNLVDGATGLPAAQTMQSRFKGSGLLITDGEGHTSRAESSLCYAKTVRRYFQKGELPDTSKHCLPVRRPFMGKKGPNVEVIDRTTWTKEDKMLFRAIDAPCPWESYCD